MIIDWTNMTVTGISSIIIKMPNEAKTSIFMDNDLTHITDDHFEIKLVARLLDQIYVVLSPQSPPRYDDTPPDPMSFTQIINNTDNLMASALMLPLHMLIILLNEQKLYIMIMYVILCLYVLLIIIDGIIF